MADTDAITGAGRADIIEGKMLYPFSAKMLGTASGLFRREAIKEYAGIVAELQSQRQPKIAEAAAVMDLIDKKTRSGDYNALRQGFIAAANDIGNLPFLLWLSLLEGDKKASIAEATALIKPDNQEAIQQAILELMGVRKPKPPVNQNAEDLKKNT